MFHLYYFTAREINECRDSSKVESNARLLLIFSSSVSSSVYGVGFFPHLFSYFIYTISQQGRFTTGETK